MKFTPEKIFDRITVSENGGELRAIYPHFIASKYDLELSVTKINGRFSLLYGTFKGRNRSRQIPV